MIKEIKLNRLEQELRNKLNSSDVRREDINRVTSAINEDIGYDSFFYYIFDEYVMITAHNKGKFIHINTDILDMLDISGELPQSSVERIVKEFHGGDGFKIEML